jgi:hypothetical protein
MKKTPTQNKPLSARENFATKHRGGGERGEEFGVRCALYEVPPHGQRGMSSVAPGPAAQAAASWGPPDSASLRPDRASSAG